MRSMVYSVVFQWLRRMSGYRKSDMMPDMFSALLSRWVRTCLPVCAVPIVFGRFHDWESRASIHCIRDAKWKINMSAFGENYKYLQIAGEESFDYNGVLFDVEEFCRPETLLSMW